MTTNSTILSKVLVSLSIISSSFISFTAQASNEKVAVIVSAPIDKNLSNNIYSFAAVIVDNRSINLDWMTKSEQSNLHFEVERSFDNSNFKTVAIVLDGFSTDTDQKAYKFKENKAELKGNTAAYYRLKQIESNGEVKFSKTIIVSFTSKR